MPPTPVAPVPRPVNGSIPYPPPNLVVPPPLRYSPSIQPVRAVFSGPGMPANAPLPLMHPPPYSATYATPPNATYPAPPPYAATPAPRLFLEPPDLFELRPVEPTAPVSSEIHPSAYPSDPMNPRMFRDFPPAGEVFPEEGADDSDDPEDPEGPDDVEDPAPGEGREGEVGEAGDVLDDVFVVRGGDEGEDLRRIRDWAEEDGGLSTVEEVPEGVEDSFYNDGEGEGVGEEGGDGGDVGAGEGDGDGAGEGGVGVGEGGVGVGEGEAGAGEGDAGAGEGDAGVGEGGNQGAGIEPGPGADPEDAEPMPAPEPVSRRTRSSGRRRFSQL